MEGLCPHGKHIGAVCVPCAEDEIIGAQWDENNMYKKVVDKVVDDAVNCGLGAYRVEYIDPHDIMAERPPTGLDAPYYDIPPSVKCIQDAVEYLNLNFANGNILKSLWREHGRQTKGTDELYEAQKRFYFAKRELERVEREVAMKRPSDA